jgi:alpha-L-fucosidase
MIKHNRSICITLSLLYLIGAVSNLPGADEVKPTLDLPIANGPFKPTMDSLEQYKCPQWFRDAKFGIWAHWGPQAVPMEGDWYARKIYQQGSHDYNYHVEHYGHPSKFGYKDIIPLWKAEKWDPDHLMSLYKKAGAQYFVSMGSHHDNFFLWESKLNRWNAVNMGPHRDVVGEWQKAAQKYGLHFGVSEHLGASFTWFQDSHRSDKTGPLAGVPYDGADPVFADLYHFPAKKGDTGWYSKDPRWQQQWYQEIQELVDNYHPDLLYSDGPVPFDNEVGLSMIAHLYNSSSTAHGGFAQVVYNCKQYSGGRWVQDLERGVMNKIDPYPWQTDTSIGDWFYNRHWKLRPVSWTIHTLVDNVSKNGNLLLNVVLRPDGSLDPEVEQMLADLADWSATQGEAIYGTRPWLVYGEGTVNSKKSGSFTESDDHYSSDDIRFTTKNGKLYAIAMGWPDDGKITVRSLSLPAGKITDVVLLGSKSPVKWEQTDSALVVTLPEQAISKYTCALRITGADLKPAPSSHGGAFVTSPGPDGKLMLEAEHADLNGVHVALESRGKRTNIGFWDSPSESVSWTVSFPTSGRYNLSIETATVNPDTPLVIEVANDTIEGIAPRSGSWDDFRVTEIGKIEVKQVGRQILTVRPKNAATWHAINLARVILAPIE